MPQADVGLGALQDVEDEELTQEELKERKIMKLLLKVKNGTPPQRKSALRQLTDKARDFGAEALFNQILPLLMSPTLEDQERHLLVKVHILLQDGKKLPAMQLSSWCDIICSTSVHIMSVHAYVRKQHNQKSKALAVVLSCRSSTVSCTSWTSWCGRSCTRSWSSLSRCSLTRTTTHEWRYMLLTFAHVFPVVHHAYLIICCCSLLCWVFVTCSATPLTPAAWC